MRDHTLPGSPMPNAPPNPHDGTVRFDPEDTQRLDDLQSFAHSLSAAIAKEREPYEELYSEESFHLFTMAPLPALSRPRRTLPKRFVVIGATMLFLFGMASPFAISGFNKAPAPASIADELEPLKLFPEISHVTEVGDEQVQADQRDAEMIVTFDSDELVTQTLRRQAPQARQLAQRERPSRAAAIPTQAEASTEASADDERDPLGALLDGALGESSPLETVEPALPQAPTRAQVLTGLRGVSAAVARCGRDQSGRVTVDVTINGPSGRVSEVRVTDGADDLTAACVSRAVRQAQFPRFADDDFRVSSFPFTVR